eukprot:COSAG06_NODE_1088_length_10748_cov_2.520331_6_plen_92_part_00
MSRAASAVLRLDLSRSHLDENGGAAIADALTAKQGGSDQLQTITIGGRAAVGVTLIFEGRIARIVQTQDASSSNSSRLMKIRFSDDGTHQH